MKRLFFLVVIIITEASSLPAQRNCLTSEYYNNILENFPVLNKRYGVLAVPDYPVAAEETGNGQIFIPVAVHIIWNTKEQKVDINMIKRQIEILNRDFAAGNADISNVPILFKPALSGDTRIIFRLDTITYTSTAQTSFDIHISKGDSTTEKNQPIKFTGQGGRDGFPCTRYLNIWVGNIKDGSGTYPLLCGYATFPGGIDKFDGVVINYECFGTPGLQSKFNEGRTVTHEVAHWLNLRHLWGIKDDGVCSNADDGVSDTPQQNHSHGGCTISTIKGACNKCPTEEMFMNYMDYVNDPCMIMFTAGQKKRMRNCFVQYPQRAALLKRGITMPGNGFAPKNILNPDILKLIQNNNFTTLEWKESNEGESFTVLIREVSFGKWEQLRATGNNKVGITELKPGVLYEVIVKVLVGRDKVIESAPYIFISESKVTKPRKDRPDLQRIQD